MGSNVEVSEAVLATAEKILAKQEAASKARREEITTKYPNADVETLEFDQAANKYSVEIICGCGARRRVYTSDLFQVKLCVECAKKAKAAKTAAKKAELAEATALVKARKAEVQG